MFTSRQTCTQRDPLNPRLQVLKIFTRVSEELNVTVA
jgi:hypothetical protein